MSEDLKILIRKRGNLKKRLTTFTNFINKYSKESITQSDADAIKIRLSKIESILDEFEEIQNEIECTVEESQLNEHYEQHEEFENDYYAAIILSRQLLSFCATDAKLTSEVDPVPRSQEPPSSQPNANITNDSIVPNNNINIKLPSIDLPKFDGNYQHWLEFKNTFSSLIHNNVSISSVHKFHYLRASLSGSASQHIHSLEFTESNYDVAWKNICDRYDNNRMLIHHHVKGLFEVANIKKDTFQSIRQLIERVQKHLQSLESLGEPITYWDTLIIYLICNKLDDVTAKEWENYKGTNKKPTLVDIFDFLHSKADQLEALSFRDSKRANITPKKITFLAQESHNNLCYNCKGRHMIYHCENFKKMSIPSRIEKVNQLNLCVNCLGANHSSDTCTRRNCRICRSKHNSLLHTETMTEVSSHAALSCQVLLATACVSVKTISGKLVRARVLLDSGSQCNFICENLWNSLGLEEKQTSVSIIGINKSQSRVSRRGDIIVKSHTSNFSFKVSCYILNQITDDLPSQDIDISTWNIPKDIKLADTLFHKKQRIDMILGAGIFWNLLHSAKLQANHSGISLQNSRLGWIVSGPISFEQQNLQCNFTKIDVQNLLEKFWTIENIPKQNLFSPEEQACESIFVNTVNRDIDGKFIVTIPFKESPDLLGDSKETATRRFQSLERKFNSNPEFKGRYQDFMREYLNLGHMSLVEDRMTQPYYFLPHHGVVNEKSLSTKLRVVFDGSAKTTSGVSLNDIQMVGPTIQDDLLSIMLRFRTHNYIIAADVKMMYREIWVQPSQRSLQMILWRENTSEPLQTYRLNTVTYGTASAPFLAVRCLHQLAHEAKGQYPKAAETILTDFYVDDLVTGASTVEEATNLANDIANILSSAGFPLRKWVSNDQSILCNIQKKLSSTDILQFGNNEISKTLGLFWKSQEDVLTYSIKNSKSVSLTKRTLLSEISKIFDIMGLISPCVIVAKIMLQVLWTHNLDWDDPVPSELGKRWSSFRQELTILNNLQIPRPTMSKNATSIEIHGFANARQSAFAACIYLRSVEDNSFTVNLLCAKSRVAPLKQVTIPRLELCAALLLTELLEKVRSSLKLSFTSVFLWSDSSIVLHWLRTPPNVLQVFVANRVAKIQTSTSPSDWHHVKSEDNPADIASRGIMPSELLSNLLWWQGPAWLLKERSYWPNSMPIFESEPPEMKRVVQSLTIATSEISIFDRFSSLTKLKRVTAFCFRFIRNLRTASKDKQVGPLTVIELNAALYHLIRCSQSESFSLEIALIKENKLSKIKASLQKLNPFLDSDGILRVGGRLSQSHYPYDKQHPIILSAKHAFTKLLLAEEHLRLFHASPQLLLSSIREKYWPISGRSLARSIVHKCIKCYRCKPNQLSPQMGNLPHFRITASSPFSCIGTDFAGPFLIKDKRGRGSRSTKCYVCLYICFATKAIHLEAVTQLTTQAFIASFRRFCSRRGKPSHVYSDNGTNFIGAHNELKKLQNITKNDNSFSNFMSSEGITWHFIPPHSPHQGGLWEAGIKSVKYHLKRVLGTALVVYEDFSTILAQIEAILNSRPLCPISSDPSDMEALTPSHFLIGRSLMSAPDPNLTSVPENRMSYFQRLQSLQQHFWRRWSKEYISELQERQKWRVNQDALKIGMLVLIKEDKLPSLLWKLGRVIEVFPGADGISRVASVQTQCGIVRRSFAKLCPLPVSEH